MTMLSTIRRLYADWDAAKQMSELDAHRLNDLGLNRYDLFEARKRHRRVVKKNADLHVRVVEAIASQEQYRLFRSYLNSRHNNGGMTHMSFGDYEFMVEDTPVDSYIMEFRDSGRLVAVCLADRLRDGLSAVYSFFEPVGGKRSLGTFMILKLVEQAQARKLDYVYLGFWINGCAKMSYKSRFRPIEIFTPEGWRPWETG